jgi:signal transduction histidine kinase
MPDLETARLDVLRAYHILDTPPEAAFDRITQLAADLFNTPMSAVSLIDADRQWFKSRVGLADPETPRAVSFCDHAMRTDEVMVVPDATEDARFAQNPLVTGDLNVRFYAGAPLKLNSGVNLGALCVIDTVPRGELSPKDRKRLETLAQLVVDELELRAAVRQLAEATQVAEATARAKSEYVANMTHELRSPLTSIIGFAGMLAASGDLTDRDKRFVERIQFASNGLLDLVNNVLDLSKLEAGAMEALRQTVELRPLLQEIVGLFSLKTEGKGIGLELHVGDEVPASLETDAGWLRQILTNLLSNAVKFTDRGGIVLTVERTEALVAFQVADTGVGIPADRLAEVFGRYEQADRSVARRFGGTGLGLAISKALAAALGGDLLAQSTPGVGSRFTLTLPAGA